MRHFVVLLVLLAAAVPLWTNKVTDADSGVSHWELFLDDHIIERNTGFQRVLHHPTPKGVVLKPNQPWETQGISVMHVGRRQNGQFECY